MKITRYVAMVLPDGAAQRMIIFPDFPDISVLGSPLRAALETARQELADQAAILKMLGVPMPPPMRLSELVSAAGCRNATPATIAVPEPPSLPNSVVQHR